MFNLKELNRSCPELGNVLRFVFVGPRCDRKNVTHNCWEVVQLAGLQILNFANTRHFLYFSMTYVALSCAELPIFSQVWGKTRGKIAPK